MNEFDLLVFIGDDELLANYDDPANADVELIDLNETPLPDGIDEDVPF